MDWLAQDWEYPNDEVYAIERYQDVVNSWHQWEEEHAAKNRLPAVIKVLTPITDEVKRNTSTVRRAHQEEL